MRRYLEKFASARRINHGNTKGTVDAYVSRVRLFLAFLDEQSKSTAPSEIERSDVDAYVKALYVQHNNTGSTRAGKLSAVKAFFAYLEYTGVIASNPCDGMPSIRFRPPAPQKLARGELKLLFALPDRKKPKGIRDRAIMATLLGAGLRSSELVGLNVDDLTDTGAFIHLRVIGKGGKQRTLTLERKPSAALRAWLMERQRSNPSSRAVFVRAKGQPARLTVGGLEDMLKAYTTKARIPKSKRHPHIWRSTWATMLYDKGIDMKEIKLKGGWSSLETVDRYIAISERALRNATIADSTWKDLLGDSPNAEEGGLVEF